MTESNIILNIDNSNNLNENISENLQRGRLSQMTILTLEEQEKINIPKKRKKYSTYDIIKEVLFY